MMLSQPCRQLSLNPLPVGNPESHRLRRPPYGNAVVADELAQLAAVEEHARVSAAKKFSALHAALYSEQSQRLNHIIQIALDSREGHKRRGIRRIMRPCLRRPVSNFLSHWMLLLTFFSSFTAGVASNLSLICKEILRASRLRPSRYCPAPVCGRR